MPDQPQVEIRQPSASELKLVFDLRWKDLYEPEGRSLKELENESTPMDNNPRVIHVAAFIENKPVSAVRIEPHPKHGDYVSLMVTDKKWRDHGFGSLVLKAAEEKARIELGISLLKLHAAQEAVDFYEANGYKKSGDDVLSSVGHTIIRYTGMEKGLSQEGK